MQPRRIAAICAAGSVLLASACAGVGTQETILVTSTQWVAADEDQTAAEEPSEAQATSSQRTFSGDVPAPEGVAGAGWAKEYEWVLDHPSDYPVSSAATYTPNGTYEYALVEATGGGAPELLLAVGGTDTSPVIAFTIGPDGKARATKDVLVMGAPGNGPGRLAVWASAKGQGLYQITTSAGAPTAASDLFTIDGAKLRSAGASEVFDNGGYLPDHQLIEWLPVADRAALRNRELTVMSPANAAGSRTAEPSTAAADQDPNDTSTFTGNVVRKTGDEIMSPKGYGMPNGQDGDSEYFILQLDSPRTVTAIHAPDTMTETISEISLGYREYKNGAVSLTSGLEWEQYVGERIEITVGYDDRNFPTDTTMPIGMMRATPPDVKVLG